MADAPASLLAGLLLGLSAGLAPGPLTALLIAATLRHRLRDGVSVALAPLLTDLPIILMALLVLSRWARADAALGAVAILGSAFLLYLAWGSLWPEAPSRPLAEVGRHPLRQGIVTNLLNPHPYLFWMGVGGPLLLRGWRAGPWPPLLFLAGFYLSLVGSKLVVALIVSRFRPVLDGRLYRGVNQALGLALVAFALLLLRDGLTLTGLR